MAIILTPQTEARLCEKARREGIDLNSLADALITSSLDWEERDQAEAIEGIKAGLKDEAEGRVRPLTAVQADLRAKHGYPESWPHDAERTDAQHVE